VPLSWSDSETQSNIEAGHCGILNPE